MKRHPIATLLTILAAISLLSLPSCSNKKEKTKTAEAPPRVPPAIVTTSSEISGCATITAIDPATRTVSLKDAAGETHKYQCGPAVHNFDQLRVGDTVTTTIIEQLKIYVQKGSGAPPAMAVGSSISRAPKGGSPEALVSETIQRNATITALDHNRHFVTIKNAEGETKTYAIEPNIDLSSIRVGDDAITQYARGLSIVVVSNRAR